MELIHETLYRYDDTLTPVPDLADGPCQISDDQLTITCGIVEATFHDGTALTADDVAFTFDVGRRLSFPDCQFAYAECFDHMLESVTALDDRTVEFRLTAPNATFMTLILPSVYIESRAAVEAAFAPLAERADELDAAQYQAAADSMFAELSAEAPDCESVLAAGEALLAEAGVEPPPRDQFVTADGAFNACQHVEWTATFLGDIALSLEADGLDALALAYRTLSSNRAPIGLGAWRFVSVDEGTRLTVEAFAEHHRGPPATRTWELRVYRDGEAARAAFANGEVNWLTLPITEPGLAGQLEDQGGVEFAIFPSPGFYMLTYNLREGRLFADPALRQAVELCIDRDATVDAATDGTGDPLYSPVEPASWAYQPDVPRPQRDTDEARRLIESVGWAEGADGIYVRDGRRLATNVLVAADFTQRLAFMDLIADQVADCGIELTVVPADPQTVLAPALAFPHIPGGSTEPFDALFIGWAKSFDPHDLLWHSDEVSSAERPGGINFIGFADPTIDDLLDAGITTSDQRERARIYREFQLRLAELRPVLFGWSDVIYEALDPRLGLTEGDLNLSSRQWPWQLEELVLHDAGGG